MNVSNAQEFEEKKRRYESIVRNMRHDFLRCEDLISIGRLYYSSNVFSVSLMYFIFASALRPENHDITFRLGVFLRNRNKLNASLSCFVKTRNNKYKVEQSSAFIADIKSKISKDSKDGEKNDLEWDPSGFINMYGFDVGKKDSPLVFSFSTGNPRLHSYAESINQTFQKYIDARLVCFNLPAISSDFGLPIDRIMYCLSLDFKPSVILYYNQSISDVADTIRLETVSWVKKLTESALVLMSLDLAKPYFENSIRLLSGVADLLVTTDRVASADLNELMRGRVFRGWHLVDKETFCDQGEVRDIDVSFVGRVNGFYEYRKPILDFIKEKAIDIFLSGSGFERKLSNAEYASVMRRSKIVINFSSFESKSAWDYHYVTNVYHSDKENQNHLKVRVFEAIEAGALLFESENNITSSWFIPYDHYIPFSNKEDLLEKLEYYLSNEEERVRISSAAHDYAQQHYHPEMYWRNIFAMLEKTGDFENLPKPRAVDDEGKMDVEKDKFI